MDRRLFFQPTHQYTPVYGRMVTKRGNLSKDTAPKIKSFTKNKIPRKTRDLI